MGGAGAGTRDGGAWWWEAHADLPAGLLYLLDAVSTHATPTPLFLLSMGLFLFIYTNEEKVWFMMVSSGMLDYVGTFPNIY